MRVTTARDAFARAVVEQSQEGILIARLDGRIVHVNPALCAMLGYSDEQLLGLSVAHLVRPDSELTLFPRIAAGGSGRLIRELVRKGGARFLAEVRGHPVEVGGEAMALCHIREVTEPSSADRERGRAQAELDRVLGSISEYLWTGDLDASGTFRVRFTSSAVERITGRAPGYYLEGVHRWLDTVHPADRPHLEQAMTELFAGHADASVQEYRVVLPDGSERHVVERVEVEVRPDGGRSFFGVVTDVTERWTAQQELDRSERRYQDLVDNASWGIVVHGPDSRIRYCNPAAARLLGLDPNLLEDPAAIPPPTRMVREDGTVLPPEELPAIRAVASQRPLHNQICGFDAPGRERTWVAASAFPIFDEDGEIDHVVVSFVEITAVKEAERERIALADKAQRAQKLESLGVLAGGIAHDFNNLLVGMLGNAELALLDLPDASPARACIEQIDESARRAAQLVGQLLAYSGGGRFAIEPIDLATLVRDMGQLLEVGISRRVTIAYDLGADLPAVLGDATQVRQIVMNLITNASEALGPAGGVVRVATGSTLYEGAGPEASYLDEELPPGRYVYVEVADDGCGMDAETLGRMFDPFFTTKFTGRGLGLSSVLGIVRGHRAAIEVRSGLGEGTTVSVLFPATGKAPDQDRPTEPRAPARLPRRTVLLVDDDDTVRNVGRRLLERLGQDVLVAEDGYRALELVAEHGDTIACVVLDLTMPRLDGEETLRELRKVCPDLPVVLSSGFDGTSFGDRFRGLELAGFVQKPYAIDAFVAVLQRALAPRG